jgi:hypothetical protein
MSERTLVELEWKSTQLNSIVVFYTKVIGNPIGQGATPSASNFWDWKNTPLNFHSEASLGGIFV